MRVLDLGRRSGDASLLIAEMVGPSGLVVRVDGSAEAIDEAEKRATIAGRCYWTRLVRADPDTFVPYERFDAVVVRVILLRQDEPTNVSHLSACVRRDGVIMLVSLQTGRKCRFDFSSKLAGEADADCRMFGWSQNDAKDYGNGGKEANRRFDAL